MTEHTPPRWADKFLRWYCNPDLLEEVQGDAHELYHYRLSTKGKAYADRNYIFDVIRFFKWSNIKRSENSFTSSSIAIFWNLNFKIAFRNAMSHKMRLATKVISLAICLAFGLILSAFILQEFSFDKFHSNHHRIFRIGAQVTLDGVVTNYAISPVALADALSEEIPEVEQSSAIFHGGRPVFTIENNLFYDEKCFIAEADFLKMFSFQILKGTADALDDPNKLVLTEATARKFFGDKDPLGQTVDMGWAQLEVSAVLKNIPANSHLQFDALVSWDTYRIDDSWANLNGYTYMLLNEGSEIDEVSQKIKATFDAHREDIEADRDYVESTRIQIAPIIENISMIHLAPALDEDVALKRSKNNLWILSGIVCLFFLTGLINHFNISLAEVTTGAKKIAVLRIFGGADANEGKALATNIIMTLIFLIPISFIAFCSGVIASEKYLNIYIETSVFTSTEFLVLAVGFIGVLIGLSKLNNSVLRKSSDLIDSLKGKMSKRFSGFKIRQMLASVQLAFSIAMIAMIVIIVNQFDFINAVDKGFEDKNTIVIPMRTDNFDAVNSFQTEANDLAGVVKADGSSFYLDNIEKKEFFEIETTTGNKKMLVSYLNCGYDYLDLLGARLLLGRNFSKDFPSDERGAYIINETAAKEFGWKNPLGQRISGPFGSDREDGEVIGMVKDFHFASLHEKIEPLIIFLVTPDWGVRYTYIKLEPLRSNAAVLGEIEGLYKNHFGADVPFEWEYLDSKFASLYKEDAEIRDLSKVGMIISIFVSCLGIFTLSSLILVMRAKEMSIRKVVGASHIEILVLHLKSFGKFLFVSAAISWTIIYLVSGNWLSNFAYHIDVSIWNFILPTVITFVVVVLISAYHGFKSSMTNAVDVLKHE